MYQISYVKLPLGKFWPSKPKPLKLTLNSSVCVIHKNVTQSRSMLYLYELFLLAPVWTWHHPQYVKMHYHIHPILGDRDGLKCDGICPLCSLFFTIAMLIAFYYKCIQLMSLSGLIIQWSFQVSLSNTLNHFTSWAACFCYETDLTWTFWHGKQKENILTWINIVSYAVVWMKAAVLLH